MHWILNVMESLNFDVSELTTAAVEETTRSTQLSTSNVRLFNASSHHAKSEAEHVVVVSGR